jgi:predicted metal-dependent hydrolase
MLKDMAQRYGFSYQRLRFSHSGGRWGSCSSTGTISLNIALMKLSDDLIYYVLAHELSHTRQMNHSAAFWREVSQIDPRYKLHRQQLKRQSPIV